MNNFLKDQARDNGALSNKISSFTKTFLCFIFGGISEDSNHQKVCDASIQENIKFTIEL